MGAEDIREEELKMPLDNFNRISCKILITPFKWVMCESVDEINFESKGWSTGDVQLN